jgi:fused signal recognition particle receptor
MVNDGKSLEQLLAENGKVVDDNSTNEAAKLAAEAKAKEEQDKLDAEAKAKEGADEAARLAAEAEAKAKEEADKLAAEAAAKAAGEPEGKKSFYELMNESKADQAKAKVAEEAKEVELSAEIKAKLDRLAAYESDPLHSAIALGASQEELKKIASEIAANDFSKLSFQQLLELDIKRATGLSGEELAAELDLLMAEHDSLSVYHKSIKEAALRSQYSSVDEESPTLKALKKAYEEKGPVQTQDVKELYELTAKQEKAEIVAVGKNFIGSQLNGVDFTESELNSILEQDYHPDAVTKYLDKDSNLQVDKFLFDAFRLRNFDKMVEAEVAKRLAVERKINAAIPNASDKGGSAAFEKVDQNKEVMKGLGLPDYIVKDMKF